MDEGGCAEGVGAVCAMEKAASVVSCVVRAWVPACISPSVWRVSCLALNWKQKESNPSRHCTPPAATSQQVGVQLRTPAARSPQGAAWHASPPPQPQSASTSVPHTRAPMEGARSQSCRAAVRAQHAPLSCRGNCSLVVTLPTAASTGHNITMHALNPCLAHTPFTPPLAHSLTHSLTHSLAHSLTHSSIGSTTLAIPRSPTHSPTHTPAFIASVDILTNPPT